MRRRDILGLAGATAAWPLIARAQHRTIRKIGFLSSASAQEWQPFVSAFLQGLRDIDHIEGQSFAIEYRWAEGRYERLPAFAADLVRSDVDLIVAVTPPAALAARAATAIVPVVFVTGADPVSLGLVASINRPGGNLTGVTFATAELASKLLQTIHQLVPNLKSIGMLVNPNNQNSSAQISDLQTAAQSVQLTFSALSASNEAEIDEAFKQVKDRGINALVIATDSFFLIRKHQLIALSQRIAVPAVYNLREYVLAGGLLSYGTSVRDAYRQAGNYVGRILKGARPGDLPILRPTKFEMVFNMQAAKALGLKIPDTLLALADEVID
jgi:putative ABC transport system substrate-binding protein